MKKKNNFFSVLKFTYMQGIKSKMFIITTFLILLAILVLPNFENIMKAFGKSDKNVSEIAIVNHTNSVTYFDLSNQLKELSPTFEFKEETDLDDIAAKLKSGNSDYRALIDFTKVGSISTVYYSSNIDESLKEQLNAIVDNVAKSLYAKQIGLNEEQVNTMLKSSLINEVIYSNDKSISKTLTVIIVLSILFLLVSFYAATLSNSVLEEKNNKIFETLLCYAKPFELMFGKITGYFCMILTQILMWILGGFILFGTPGPFVLSPKFLILSTVSIVLGFFIYTCLFMALTSFSNSAQESSQLNLLGILPLIISYYVVYFSITTSGISMLHITSFIPFSAPFSSMAYFVLEDVSTVEIVLNIVVQILEVIVVGLICSKLYSKGICGTKLFKGMKKNLWK